MLKSIGLIETKGVIAAIEAADVMLKNSQVKLLGKEIINSSITIFIWGEPEQVQIAVNHGAAAAKRFGKLIAAHVITNPAEELMLLLPSLARNKQESKIISNFGSEFSGKIPIHENPTTETIPLYVPIPTDQLSVKAYDEIKNIDTETSALGKKKNKESKRKNPKVKSEVSNIQPNQPEVIFVSKPQSLSDEIEVTNNELPAEERNVYSEVSTLKERVEKLEDVQAAETSAVELKVSIDDSLASVVSSAGSTSEKDKNVQLPKQKKNKKIKEDSIKTPSLFDKDYGNDTIARLKREALGVLKQEVEITKGAVDASSIEDIPKSVKSVEASKDDDIMSVHTLEKLSSLNVHQLRRAARDFNNFPIKGRQISKANRETLLSYFSHL
ncbi:MAG: BMC domain-containing protein [Ignavibacteriaceae bacterium]|nr:BMC domain-containing protein [Ignavibacteriaceae bacterium]